MINIMNIHNYYTGCEFIYFGANIRKKKLVEAIKYDLS